MSTSLEQRPDPAPETPARDEPAAGRDRRPSGARRDYGLNVRRLRITRAIVFAILALPILALAGLTVRFVSMPIAQAHQLAAYEDGDYPEAIERLGPLDRLNWFEPYMPHLDRGTALLQQGEDAAAEAELRVAMSEWESRTDLNAPLHAQCKIANNLAISIERQADLIEDPQQRADRLFEAEEILQPCRGGGGGGGEGEGQGGSGSGNEDEETTEGNGERVEEKRRAADEEAGNDPDARGGEEQEDDGGTTPMDPGDPVREDPEGDGPEEEKPTEGDPEQQQKDEELEQRNRDAQEEGGDGEGDGGAPQDPSKPW